MNKPIEKICVGCGKQFQTISPAQKYCGRACFGAHYPRKGKVIKCLTCNKEFYIPVSMIGIRKYCSQKCSQSKNRNKVIELTCKTCGKKYTRSRSQVSNRGSAYCSDRCRNKAQRVTKKTVLDRMWADVIKLKANYRCEYCGKGREVVQLHAHHIFGRRHNSVRWSIENGICLCASHHRLGKFSAHQSPLEFGLWIIQKRGQQWYEKLRLNAHKIVQIRKADREIIGEKLKTMRNNEDIKDRGWYEVEGEISSEEREAKINLLT